MTVPSRTAGAGSRATDRHAAVRPPFSWRASLPVASGTAGLVSVGAFGHPSSGALFFLGISSALCAVVAGIVAVVKVMAGRSPEIRRMTALRQLALRASSPAERLSAMAMLSLTASMTGAERENTTRLIHLILQATPAAETVADPPQAAEPPSLSSPQATSIR